MRFGLARREITPPFPARMHGYSARQDVFDEVHDPLTFTAVVLEEGSERAVIGAADLCTFPNDGTLPAFMDRLAGIAGCVRDRIMLNASHTHGGPHTPGRSPMSKNPSTSERYRDWLYEEVAAAVGEAAGGMEEGTLWYGEGKTGLPMNRRPDRDGTVPNAPNPGGPVDDRMQLLALKNARGEPRAVGMRLSCHPVATGAQHRITADFPGAWRSAFARAFGPGVLPFFLQGAGADARPRYAADGDRWRSVRHAELAAIGEDLLAETLAIVAGPGLRPVENLRLRGRIQPVQAPCERLYATREGLEAIRGEEGLRGQYAAACLALLDADQAVPETVTFHVQTLWLNPGLALIGLDVEPLCGLGAAVEGAVRPEGTILLGYNNGCIAYAPDAHEARRGGYEVTSYLYSVWSGPLLPGLETLFAGAVMPRP
jgi:hypothetical protein